jgi:hypothetical protein
VNARSNDPPVKIVREVPLTWLIALVLSILIHAVLLWDAQQSQGAAIKDMSAEVRELRGAVNASGLKAVELDVRVADHERRLAVLERAQADTPKR